MRSSKVCSEYEISPEVVAVTLLARRERGDSRAPLLDSSASLSNQELLTPDTQEFSAKPHDSESAQVIGSGLSSEASYFKLDVERTSGLVMVRTALGRKFRLSRDELAGVEPDPLWESAEGICAHMDEDHSDTYEKFLAMIGVERRAESVLSMPWVERHGFFLYEGADLDPQGRPGFRSLDNCFHWVRFPSVCDTPNEVRKTLIQMLRGHSR